MTISTTQSNVTLQGNGTTTVFTYPFVVPAAIDLYVQILDTTSNPPTLTNLTSTQYTVTGIGNVNGGTVTYPLSGSPLAAGQYISIIRLLPYLQLVTLANQGNFYPAAIEAGLDNLEMQIQQIANSTATAIRFPLAEPPGANPITPTIAERANQLLGFDGSGNVIAAQPSDAPVSSAWQPVVAASTTFGGLQLIQYRDAKALGTWYRPITAKLDDFVSLLDFADVDPTGATDSSSGINFALLSAKFLGRAIYVPPGVYRIDNPINGTNSNYPILIYGAGGGAPITFGTMTPLMSNTTFVGNTGAGIPAFDFTGTNDVTLRDFTIETWTASNPSTIGMMFGTSTGAPLSEWKGGAAIALEDISVAMGSTGSVIPIAVTGGCGPFYMRNVWVQGDYGIAFSTNNDLGVASPFVTVLTGVGVGSVVGNNVSALGWGTQPVLYIEQGTNMTFEEFYTINENAGGGFSGQNYPVYIDNSVSISIRIRSIGWPSVVDLADFIEGLEMTGTSQTASSPLGVGIPVVAHIGATSLANSSFAVSPGDVALSGDPFFYISPDTATPTLASVKNTTFLFNTVTSAAAAYINCGTAEAVPFFNITFNGDADGPTLTFEVNGSAAASGNERYFVNGKAFGSG